MMALIILITLLSLHPDFTGPVCQITNCAQCNGISECDSCNDGFWLEGGKCHQCPSYCSRCTHSSQCQSCVTSYWKLGMLCNSECPAYCTERGCDDITGYCYECKPGKYGRRCDEDCFLCINKECDLRKCTHGCKDGYVQVDINTGYELYKLNTNKGYSYCRPCSQNCIRCSDRYCTRCKRGFYRQYHLDPDLGAFTQCIQCVDQCTQCTPTVQCAKCNSDCIIERRDVSGDCVTTSSEIDTSTNSTTVLFTAELITQTPTKHTDTKSTIRLRTELITKKTTKHTAPNVCMEGCDVLGKCQDTTTRYSKSDSSSRMCTENDYYEGLGHGIATGIRVIIAVGALLGVVVFFIRRTKCHQTICRTNSPEDSRKHHVYVNTQKEADTWPTTSPRPGYNEANLNKGFGLRCRNKKSKQTENISV